MKCKEVTQREKKTLPDTGPRTGTYVSTSEPCDVTFNPSQVTPSTAGKAFEIPIVGIERRTPMTVARPQYLQNKNKSEGLLRGKKMNRGCKLPLPLTKIIAGKVARLFNDH